MQIKNSPLSLSPFTIRTVLLGLLATTVAAAGTWITLEISNDSPRVDREAPSSVAETPALRIANQDGVAVPSDAAVPQKAHWPSQVQTPSVSRESAPTQTAWSRSAPAQSTGFVRQSQDQPDQDQFTPLEAPTVVQPARGPMILEVSPGVRLPAILMEADEVLSPQAAAIKERIAEEFAQEIRDAVDPEKSEDPSKPEVAPDEFDPAVRRADERYRMFFGDAAYNQRTMQAAKQAVSEKKKK